MNSSYNQYFNSHSHPPKSPQQDHPIKDNTKTNTKPRKSKGVVRLSTDPQSVAARERRHRISHRLKTLQSIVPGGSKLDTVSLLDHAIHYVHFLNSQIRFHHYCLLLSKSSAAAMAGDHGCLLPPDSCFSSLSVDRNVYVGPPGDSYAVVDPSRFLPPLPAAASYDREDCDHGCFCVDVSDGNTSVVDF